MAPAALQVDPVRALLGREGLDQPQRSRRTRNCCADALQHTERKSSSPTLSAIAAQPGRDGERHP